MPHLALSPTSSVSTGASRWGITVLAIFASKHDHCLVDLLYRQRSGELACDFPLIISNHPDAKRHADFYGLPFHVISVTRENKPQAEVQQLELLAANNIGVVVLARYMQVLSSDFISQFPMPIINIHHSFLPAFVGAKPHQQAYDRGVKILGATVHYVTDVSTTALSSSKAWSTLAQRQPEDLVRRAATSKIVLSSRPLATSKTASFFTPTNRHLQ
jgi:formyltetrahydrofolate deformylase